MLCKFKYMQYLHLNMMEFKILYQVFSKENIYQFFE